MSSNNQKKPLITVAVAVYNVQAFLEACVQSITSQSYANLDIILVDDGSTDSSAQLCDLLAKTDDRIRVIHKPNGGLASARNAGVAHAKGDFITFVDSDDVIHPGMVKLLYESLETYSCDMSVCGLLLYYNGDSPNTDLSDNATYVATQESALVEMLYQKDILNVSVAKLYCIDLFTSITFDEKLSVAEDLDASYKIFSLVSKVAINNGQGYYYYQRPGSIMRSKFSRKRMDGLDLARRIYEDATTRCPYALRAAKNRYFMEAVSIFLNIPRNDPQFKPERVLALSVIKQHRMSVALDNESKREFRLYALIAIAHPMLLRWLHGLKKAVVK